jgi:phosphinothricin acetyltransferase
MQIREASRSELPRLTEIYNCYVIHTPITFNVELYTSEQRAGWFDDHCDGRRYRITMMVEPVSTRKELFA